MTWATTTPIMIELEYDLSALSDKDADDFNAIGEFPTELLLMPAIGEKVFGAFDEDLKKRPSYTIVGVGHGNETLSSHTMRFKPRPVVVVQLGYNTGEENEQS